MALNADLVNFMTIFVFMVIFQRLVNPEELSRTSPVIIPTWKSQPAPDRRMITVENLNHR